MNLFDEVRKIGKVASSHNIVQGKNYLYFCIQPTQDNMVFQQVLKKTTMSVIAVYNIKDNIVGYLIEFFDKPFLSISDNSEGVGIFFSKEVVYKKPKVIYSKNKIRLLQFGTKDFYFSIKWKSTTKEEG